jgi:hypothetical protein
LVSSEYLFGIFWIPLWYLQTFLRNVFSLCSCILYIFCKEN